MKKKLFVLGCARSGTSALTIALNSHPEISIGMERYISLLDNTGKLENKLFEKERFFSISEGDTFYNELSQINGNPSRQEFEKSTYVGDKIPKLYNYIEMLLRNFEGAKIISIVRDPLSVAASFETRAQDTNDIYWNQNRNAVKSVAEWNSSLSKVLPYVKSRSILPISYERLFFDGHGWERIRQFLDLKTDFENPKKTTPFSKILNLRSDITEFIRQNARWDLYAEFMALIHNGNPHDFYSRADQEMIEYGSKPLPGFSIAVRDAKQKKVICLGSAATFGRFVENPYPRQIDASNFGIGGARPEAYRYEPVALSRIAEAEISIFEVMSARGYRNELISPINRFTNIVQFKHEDFKNLHFPNKQNKIFIDRFWEWAFARNSDLAETLIQVAQESWLADMKDLFRFSKRPIILWFSQTGPKEQFADLDDYKFPHFVSKSMLSSLNVEIVEVVSNKGIPFRLKDRCGKHLELLEGWPDPSLNSYYPSQEMHDEAAKALLAKI